MIRIGVDTGGTFTDLVRFGPEGVSVHKVRSTPDDPSRAIVAGHRRRRRRRHRPRRRARVDGRDQRRARAPRRPRGARRHRRLRGRRPHRPADTARALRPDAGGSTAPGRSRAHHRRPRAARRGRAAADPPRRRRDRARRRAASARPAPPPSRSASSTPTGTPSTKSGSRRPWRSPGSTSRCRSRVLREYREYERWSTTIVNAYVTPHHGRATSARSRPASPGIASPSCSRTAAGSPPPPRRPPPCARSSRDRPAGAVGARAVAEAAGHPRVIGFDMGGTSTDVCLIDGAIPTTADTMVGDFPVRLPVIDIHSVGAGGGSIVYVDSGGALRVGPRSAGAVPGPVCYGQGTELTVTDANLLLGRLDPGQFLGGRMTLDVERARRVAADLARRVGLDEPALAEGVVRIANANMERAIRVVSVQRGVDPRDFALLAFGGAGGMHACAIAETLDIATVIVPRHAGVLSALGMLLADVIKDYALTILRAGDAIDAAELDALFAPLVERRGARPGARRLPARPDPRRAPAGRALRRPVVRARRADGAGIPRRVRSPARADLRLRRSAPGDRGGDAARRRGRAAPTSRSLPRVEAPPSIAEPYRVRRGALRRARWSRPAFFRWRDLAAGRDRRRARGDRRRRGHGRRPARLPVPARRVRQRGRDPAASAADVRMRIDPIAFEIFKNLFVSVAEEMGVTLCRTSFSPNIKERLDYSCAIYDAAGETIAQGDHMPVHLGAMPLSVRAAIDHAPMQAGRRRRAERSVPRRHAPARHHAGVAGLPRARTPAGLLRRQPRPSLRRRRHVARARCRWRARSSRKG